MLLWKIHEVKGLAINASQRLLPNMFLVCLSRQAEIYFTHKRNLAIDTAVSNIKPRTSPRVVIKNVSGCNSV